MAAFHWMLIEGIDLYFFVVKVYNINTKMYMYHVISWVILHLLMDLPGTECQATCFKNSSYYFSKSGRIWDQNKRARSDQKGYLVSIETEEEWQFINREIQKRGTWNASAWHIVLEKKGKVWTWLSGETLNISKWRDSEPDGNDKRAEISKNGGFFNSISKLSKNAYICETPGVLAIQKAYRQNARGFHFEEQQWQARINIASSNFEENGSLVVATMYKDLHDLLLTDQTVWNETDNQRYINSRIMAVTMEPKARKLRENVILKFKNLKVLTAEKRCMFWSGLNKSFSEEGCHVVTSKSNSEETVCSCNHLTHFAVLMDFDGSTKLAEEDETILKIITFAGLSLSIFGILLTLILYSCLTDVCQPLSQIRLSVSVSFLAGQIIFLAGTNVTENKAACVTIAALMQYFLTAAFCWMLIEGIYLYFFVVKVYNINNKMYMYHDISWGLPVIMVAISLGIAAGKEGLQSYTSDKHCWLSSTNKLIWIFVAFEAFTEVGFLIFALHCMQNTQIRQRFKRKMNVVFPSSIKQQLHKEELTGQSKWGQRCMGS